jgi:hypothetical protein
MMKKLDIIYKILTFILLLYSFFIPLSVENFTSNNSLTIKKTLTYDLVLHNKEMNYSIWTPRPINDFYPLGHVCTEGKQYPKILSILVKSEEKNNPRDRPVRYEPSTVVSNIKKGGFFWKPITYKGYKSLGHIYHDRLPNNKIPSVHKHIRCIPNKYVLTTGIGDVSIKNKSNGQQIWSINDSPHFISNEKSVHSEPSEKVFKINPKFLNVEKKIKTKKTKSYELIYEKYNQHTKEYFVIWRPTNTKNFVSVGDIVINKSAKNYNPNNNLETLLVNKSITKPPEGFGTQYVSSIIGKNIEATFWKPEPPTGYGCLGFVCTKGDIEPTQSNIINCIPLEYLDIDVSKEKVWSSIQIPNVKMSIWKDSNNFFHTNNSYSEPNEMNFKLIDKFIEYEADLLDEKANITLNYELNKSNTELYNSDIREKLYRNSITSRTGIKDYRLDNIEFQGNKVLIDVKPRPAGTEEPKVSDIIDNIKTLIKGSNLKIQNSKKDSHISNVIKFTQNTAVNPKSIELDNTRFNRKML